MLSVDGATLVDGFTNDVDDTAETLGADSDGDGCTGVDDLGASDETLGTVWARGGRLAGWPWENLLRSTGLRTYPWQYI